MQVQILLDGKVLSTQQVSMIQDGDDPTIEARRIALRAAIKDGSVAIEQILRVKFRLDDQKP